MLNGKKIALHGPAGAHHSISKCLRETARALHGLGYPVGIQDTEVKPTWADPRYRAMTRHLMDPSGAEAHYALDEYRGDGQHVNPGWTSKLPGQKARGYLFDKFEFDESWLQRSRAYDFIVAVSRHAAEFLVERGVENVQYAPLGVNMLDYYPVDPTPEILRGFQWIQQGSINRDTLVLLHCGSLQRRKGTEELLRAYRQAFTRHDNVVLLMQSSHTDWSKDYGATLVRKIGTAAPLAWCGSDLTISEQRRLYALASVTVSPNYVEGFGLMAAESMACGVPVVMPLHSGNLETYSPRCCVALTEGVEEDVTGVRQISKWWRPNVDELVEVLRSLRDDPEGLRRKSQHCVANAATLSWDRGAETIARRFGMTPDLPAQDGIVTVATLCLKNAQQCESHALKTVYGTEGQFYRHVLVDNGSTEQEDLQAACERYGVQYMRHDNPRNFGVVATNFVWGQCRTEFCARVDDDVCVQPDTLAKCVAHLKAHPACGAVGCVGLYPNGTLWAAGAQWSAKDHCMFPPGCGKPPQSDVWVDRHVLGVTFSLVVMRTKVMLDVAGIGRDYAPCWCDDSDMCLAIRAAGHEIHCIASTTHTNELSPTCGSPQLRGKHEAKLRIFYDYWSWILDGDEPRAVQHIGEAVRGER